MADIAHGAFTCCVNVLERVLLGLGIEMKVTIYAWKVIKIETARCAVICY